jgi:hypothetical protein
VTTKPKAHKEEANKLGERRLQLEERAEHRRAVEKPTAQTWELRSGKTSVCSPGPSPRSCATGSGAALAGLSKGSAAISGRVWRSRSAMR